MVLFVFYLSKGLSVVFRVEITIDSEYSFLTKMHLDFFKNLHHK